MPVDDDPTREVHQAVDQLTRLALAGAVAATEAGARRRADQERQAEAHAREAERQATVKIVEHQVAAANSGISPTSVVESPQRMSQRAERSPVKGVTAEQLAAVSLGHLAPEPAVAAGRD